MNGFLLDTNVLSEVTKPRPEIRVQQWLKDVDDSLLYISVMTLSEILKGITRLDQNTRRALLEQWLDNKLRPWFEGRILPVTQPIAERLGRLAGQQDALGFTLPVADGIIAATALEDKLTVVTRNIKDFTRFQVSLLNPWDSQT